MKTGDRVKLNAFNGTKTNPVQDDSEDYWKLVGETGTIRQDPFEKTISDSYSPESRVLVQFDCDIVASFGLPAHNNTKNSLWILVSDLEKLTEGD